MKNKYTKKTILIALIAHYKQVIENLPKLGVIQLNPYLSINNVQFGICSCSAMHFDHYIYTSKWVIDHCDSDGNWLKVPRYCTDREEVLSVLKGRVKIMKKILKTCK
jgi:hypothetical protein